MQKKTYTLLSRNALHINRHSKLNILNTQKYPCHWYLRSRIKLEKPAASARWINSAVIGNGAFQNMSEI